MTDLEKDDILKMSETDTFFLIDECGAFMWRMNHEISHGKIPEEALLAVKTDVVNVGDLQKFAVDNLLRFGVDPASVKDRENGDYWKWYAFWDKWRKDMSEEQWKLCAKGDYTGRLPLTNWKGETLNNGNTN